MRCIIPLTLIFVVTLVTSAIPGCIAPADKDRVAEAQLDAMVRLRGAYAEDLAALRAAIGALARVSELTRRTGIEADLVDRYVTPTGAADLAAFDAALALLAGEPAPDALVAEVRAGLMTPDAARDWLSDYALAWRMTAGAEARDRLLAGLTPVRDLDAAHAALLSALDERAAAVQRLFADALASADALAQARALEHELLDPVRGRLAGVWRDRVLARVTDPESRRLIETVLADFAPDLVPTPASP